MLITYICNGLGSRADRNRRKSDNGVVTALGHFWNSAMAIRDGSLFFISEGYDQVDGQDSELWMGNAGANGTSLVGPTTVRIFYLAPPL